MSAQPLATEIYDFPLKPAEVIHKLTFEHPILINDKPMSVQFFEQIREVKILEADADVIPRDYDPMAFVNHKNQLWALCTIGDRLARLRLYEPDTTSRHYDADMEAFNADYMGILNSDSKDEFAGCFYLDTERLLNELPQLFLTS